MDSQRSLIGIWFDWPGGHDSTVLSLGADGHGFIETKGPGWTVRDNFLWTANYEKGEITFVTRDPDKHDFPFLFEAPLKFIIGLSGDSNDRETLELGRFSSDPEPIQYGSTKIDMRGGWVTRNFWRPSKLA